MRFLIFASLLFCAQMASTQSFVDQIDGGSALICSKVDDNWTCEIILVEELRELGYTDVEGTILIDEPEEEKEEPEEVEAPGC